jgi:hypothetical protein
MATPVPGTTNTIITDNTNSAATIESPNGAQSPVPSPAAFQHGATGERTFTEADIAKARKEEKDKLYSELASMKDALKEIQEQKAAELAEAQRKQQEKEAAAQAKREEEMSAKALLEAKLKETNDTWEARFKQLQDEREQERALLAKEREYNDLVDYRNAQLQANANDIAPQFHSFITGDNKEQIDTAIANAKAATDEIYREVAAARQQQPQQRGVAPTGFTAMGPLDGTMGQKTYSPDDINKMSMAEYAKFRQESGLAGRDAQRNAGLFG